MAEIGEGCFHTVIDRMHERTGEYEPVNGLKLGIYPPWQCMNTPEDFAHLKRMGFSLLNSSSDPNQDLFVQGVGLALRDGWNANEILYSLPCYSIDEFNKYFKRMIEFNNSYDFPPFYGVSFDEPHFRCDAWKTHGKEMCRVIKNYSPSTLIHTIGYFGRLDDLLPGFEEWYNDDLDDSGGMVDVFMLDNYVDPWSQIFYWVKLRYGSIFRPQTRRTTGWIIMGRRSSEIEDKFPNHMFFDTLLGGGHVFPEIWLYCGDLCDEMIAQIGTQIRRIIDPRRDGVVRRFKDYLTNEEEFGYLLNSTIDFEINPRFELDPELRPLFEGNKDLFYKFLHSCIDNPLPGEKKEYRHLCSCGFGRELLCSMYKRRLQMFVDAAVRTGWLKEKSKSAWKERCFRCIYYPECALCPKIDPLNPSTDPHFSELWEEIDCEYYRQLIGGYTVADKRLLPAKGSKEVVGMEVFRGSFDIGDIPINNRSKKSKKERSSNKNNRRFLGIPLFVPLFLFVQLLCSSCNLEGPIVGDERPVYVKRNLYGKVIDAETNIGIDSVLFAEKDGYVGAYPYDRVTDDRYFDSLAQIDAPLKTFEDSCWVWTYSENDGNFQAEYYLSWTYNHRTGEVTSGVRGFPETGNLFAYKKGYTIWRFDDSRDTLKILPDDRPPTYTREFLLSTIRLHRK